MLSGFEIDLNADFPTVPPTLPQSPANLPNNQSAVAIPSVEKHSNVGEKRKVHFTISIDDTKIEYNKRQRFTAGSSSGRSSSSIRFNNSRDNENQHTSHERNIVKLRGNHSYSASSDVLIKQFRVFIKHCQGSPLKMINENKHNPDFVEICDKTFARCIDFYMLIK